MLMFIYSVMPLFIFILGVMVFVSKRKHLLSVLLSLEFMVWSLFFLLFNDFNLYSYERD